MKNGMKNGFALCIDQDQGGGSLPPALPGPIGGIVQGGSATCGLGSIAGGFGGPRNLQGGINQMGQGGNCRLFYADLWSDRN
jgi:hypothetical protein